MALQIEHDRRFHQRERRFQLAASLAVAAVVLSALLGLFGGPGMWSTSTAADSRLLVQFEQVSHQQADESVTIAIGPEAVTGDTVDLDVSAQWLQALDIRAVAPEPDQQTAAGEAVRLTFNSTPGTPVTVTIGYRVTRFTVLHGWVALPGAERVSFRQFVLP